MDLRVNSPEPQPICGKQTGSNRLQSLLNRAPEFAEAAATKTAKFHPAARRLYAVRRRIATVGVAILTGWLFVHVMFGANGMVVYREKRAEYQSLQRELGNLQKQNEVSTKQIEGLRSDPNAIEKIAREQFHYTKPGEFVLVSPPRPASPLLPDTNAAHK